MLYGFSTALYGHLGVFGGISGYSNFNNWALGSPKNHQQCLEVMNGGSCRDRTYDPVIKSHLLLALKSKRYSRCTDLVRQTPSVGSPKTGRAQGMSSVLKPFFGFSNSKSNEGLTAVRAGVRQCQLGIVHGLLTARFLSPSRPDSQIGVLVARSFWDARPLKQGVCR